MSNRRFLAIYSTVFAGILIFAVWIGAQSAKWDSKPLEKSEADRILDAIDALSNRIDAYQGMKFKEPGPKEETEWSPR
jgi:hypothetical protein